MMIRASRSGDTIVAQHRAMRNALTNLDAYGITTGTKRAAYRTGLTQDSDEFHMVDGWMKRVSTAVRPFTACTECPRCDLIAVHWLDEPRKASDEDWAAYREALTDHDPLADPGQCALAWKDCVGRVITNSPGPQPPDNEDFTVARICVDCGYRWGMS